jgi:hypothetical protein
MYCLGIFIDLRKAFDVCSHEILLKKLKLLGITGISLAWFESYLSDRTQTVDIGGTISEEKALLLSVIQGSILGPILFLCYINDIYTCTTLFTSLFADDGTGLAKDKNLTNLINYVNKELQKIANWFLSNKMAVNTAKTKYIIFRTHGKTIPDNLPLVVFNSNEIGTPDNPQNIFPIERIHNHGATKTFKLLGVLLDEYLSFEPHINMLCNKVSKSLYIINRVKNILPQEALKSLYHALVHSHLSYCATIYGSANRTSLNKLVLKQKQAIRIISHSNYRASTSPIFKKTNILPLLHQIKYLQLKFMHNFHYNKLPFSFNNAWITNRMRNPQVNLRNSDDLYIPPHNFKSIKRLQLFQLPRVWNEEEFKNIPESRKFLVSVKNRLLSSLN